MDGHPAANAFVFDVREIDPREDRLFGGKATGLARMARAEIPVPPAFAINTDAFRAWQTERRLPEGLRDQMDAALKRLNAQVGRDFGGDGASADPMLVSVRSGAQISMPGMMDTVLNLGLDATSAAGMIARGRSRRFVIDSWARFWKMYVEIVLGLDSEEFLEAIAPARKAAEEGGDLAAFEAAVVAWVEEQGEEAPTAPRDQLDKAVSAVFASWNSPRAKAYREHQKIPHDLGTAVTVQAMVFGNADEASGSGVAFSRDPNTGEPILYGEYLAGRQGEDIVAGTATPADLSKDEPGNAELRAALLEHSRALEAIYRDSVDIEFTVESGKLYLLQVRAAKRTAAAAVRIAADLVAEGLIREEEALSRVSAEQIKRLLRPVFAPDQLAAAQIVGSGIGSSPGQTSGAVVFDSDRAAERAATGEPVILVRPTTSPLDIRGMIAAAGILTAKGGALSHAAVVSRALDRPCVVGCEALQIDEAQRVFSVGGRSWREGDWISIDGATGEIFGGKLDLIAPDGRSAALARLLEGADRISGAEVWTTSRPQQGAAPKGIAVVSMADVAIKEGVIDRLAEGIASLGRDPEGGAALLREAAAKVAAAALRGAEGLPVHIRLPQASSRRAHFIVPDWLSLDQTLFLPLGNSAYHAAILAGLDQGAGEGGRLTAVMGGVTDPAEWLAWRRAAAAFPGLGAGVAIQNAAGLEAVPEMLAEGGEGGSIWIDLEEVLDSAHGFVSRAYAPASVLEDYVSQGLLRSHPRKSLKPFLAELFRKAGALGDPRLGLLCSGECDEGLIRQLSDVGFRLFAAPRDQRDLMRALLGKAAARRISAKL